MSNKTIKIDTENNYRVVAISDVHGHKDILERLLDKVNLTKDDYLIIIGDFINKGIDSYQTYEFIKELSKRKNTLILKGNHEYFIHSYLENEEKFAELYDFLKCEYYETIIDSLLKDLGKGICSFKNSKELYHFLHDNYNEMLQFLRDLPIMVHLDDFIFVHGGYDEEFCLEKDEAKFLKFDNYNDISKINKNKIIVGHWPTCNLESDKLTNVPFFNDEKNIICIDGGLGVKRTGELNAFIIDKKDNKIYYNYLQENNFKRKKITKEHFFQKEKDSIYVNYPHYDFEILEHGEFMTKCKHIHSKKVFSVFNSLLVKKDDKYELKTNYINNYLNLKVNDEIEVCLEYEDCILVKNNEEFGWILSHQIK